VTSLLLALLDRLVSQETARTNAAQASADLIRNRLQLEDEAFLDAEGTDPWDLPAITHGR
jgi:hypothetical protein